MINFPHSPVINQVFSSGSRSWKWDGSAWVSATIDYNMASSSDVASESTIQTGHHQVGVVSNTIGLIKSLFGAR